MTTISSARERPRTASAAQGLTSSQASGAPSDPCLGASPRALSPERITPTGRSRAPTNARLALALIEGAAPNELVPEREPLERARIALGEEALRAPGKRKFRASPGQHRRRVRFANPRFRRDVRESSHRLRRHVLALDDPPPRAKTVQSVKRDLLPPCRSY